jgi:hypothetical protein
MLMSQMIIPTFEEESMTGMTDMIVNQAIHAKRCRKCNKVLFVNLLPEDDFVCRNCRHS